MNPELCMLKYCVYSCDIVIQYLANFVNWPDSVYKFWNCSLKTFNCRVIHVYSDSIISWALLEIGHNSKSSTCTSLWDIDVSWEVLKIRYMHHLLFSMYRFMDPVWKSKEKFFFKFIYIILVYFTVLTIKVSLISLFVLGTGTEISPPCIHIIFRLAAGFSCLKCWNLDYCTPLLSRNSLTTIFPSFVSSITPYWRASSE